MQALGTECIQGSSAKGPLRCQGSPARSRHAQLSAARSACHGGCCWLSLEALLLVQARGEPRGLESPLSAEAAGLAASSSFLRERLAGRGPQALSPGQVAVLPFPRPRAPQAWLGLHRLSQSLVAEEPQGHRASASGSAVSEVTGGTPVLCKYRGQRGRRAGWLQPSIILARGAGDRHSTMRLAPNLFVFPLSPAIRPAATGSQFRPAWPPPLGGGGKGGDSRGSHRGIPFGLQRLPQHCLCRRAVALKT